MNRRSFVLSSVAGTVSAFLSDKLLLAKALPTEQLGTPNNNASDLFSFHGLSDLTWSQFEALGFTKPVCGVIHRKNTPTECGVPLGSIGTGCIDLDTDGTLGYCSIFNSFVPPRGKLHLPFLGLKVGTSTWVLATRYTSEIEKVEAAQEIHYWGHYPVADLEYETTAPVKVALRAWTPFIPGDLASSNTPAAIFELRLRNTTKSRQTGSLVFSFPGPTPAESQISPKSARQQVIYNWFTALTPICQGPTPADRTRLNGELRGIVVKSDRGNEYCLAVMGSSDVQMGAPLGSIGNAWSNMQPPVPTNEEFGTSLHAGFDMEPGERKVIRFVLSWYAPVWKGQGDHYFRHMYATRYSGSIAVAQKMASEHTDVLRRILAWQQAVYTYDQLPVWLRESLVNSLYLITEVGLWAAAEQPIGAWCRKEDGLFAMNESPRECPQMECIPCSFYGNIPVVYFFPELAASTMRGYKAYQYSDGAVPWIFGGCTGNPPTEGTEMAMPNRGYQTTTNGISYADMVDKYWLRSGDDGVLREFYPSVKQNMIYTMKLNTGPDGVISMPAGNVDPANGEHATEWVEGEKWYGMTVHVGGLHLAQLRIVKRMAERVGDADFAAECERWLKQGGDSMEKKMWAGEYYSAYLDPDSGKRSDRIFSCQLDGDWISLFHGLPPVFRADRARTTLATIKRKNARLSSLGIVFLCNPDGTPWEEAGYGPYTYFVSEQLMLAMTYIYAGDTNFGLDQARVCMENLLKRGYYWNQPCIVQAKTGERISGYDYYQNLMIWSLPAALDGGDLRTPCAKGGLVDRVINAGRA